MLFKYHHHFLDWKSLPRFIQDHFALFCNYPVAACAWWSAVFLILQRFLEHGPCSSNFEFTFAWRHCRGVKKTNPFKQTPVLKGGSSSYTLQLFVLMSTLPLHGLNARERYASQNVNFFAFAPTAHIDFVKEKRVRVSLCGVGHVNCVAKLVESVTSKYWRDGGKEFAMQMDCVATERNGSIITWKARRTAKKRSKKGIEKV